MAMLYVFVVIWYLATPPGAPAMAGAAATPTRSPTDVRAMSILRFIGAPS
jgi:hypothetical protein